MNIGTNLFAKKYFIVYNTIMDLNILEWINNNLHGVEIINEIIAGFSAIGDSGFIWIVLGIILACFRKTRAAGLTMIVSLAAGWILNDLIIKELVARPRPFIKDANLYSFVESLHTSMPDGYSFPSGHSFSSLNCSVILICFFGKKAWPALVFGI